MDNHELDFIEVIQLLKQLNENTLAVHKALGELDLSVDVKAPIVSVEPTPITVNEAEMPSQIKASVSNLDEVGKYINLVTKKLADGLKIANLNEIKQAKLDLAPVEKLLKQLIKQKAVVDVKVEPEITIPTSFDPKKYIPVRLTDGTNFYNAGAGGSRGGGASAGLITFAFDRVAVTAYNDNNDPTQVKYYYNSHLKGTLDITYDESNRVTNAILS